MTMTTTREPIHIEHLPIDQLRPDPFNPRKISDAELNALTESIRKFGLVDPILVRSEDRTIIGGHQRVVAARRLGYTTVPVVELDLSLEEARLLNIGLNKLGGSFDQELLARLLGDCGRHPALTWPSPGSTRPS